MANYFLSFGEAIESFISENAAPTGRVFILELALYIVVSTSLLLFLYRKSSLFGNSVKPTTPQARISTNDSASIHSTSSSSSSSSVYKFNISGWTICSYFQQAKHVLNTLKMLYPTSFEVNIYEHPDRASYMSFLKETDGGFRNKLNAPQHETSPIVWFDGNRYLGGRDDTLAWTRKHITVSDSAPAVDVSQFVDAYNPAHGFQYDCVIIGGGPGGLASAKEMKKLGANVALLDFVIPSSQGTQWSGLGGTSVNVGCIPNKLIHTAALMGECNKDSSSYGWKVPECNAHSWEDMRNNVVDHIKTLNKGYEDELREKGVVYMNKRGRFVGPNQLECIDAKGVATVITAARFVMAVGGRPKPLDCPGAEYTISSDDLLYLEKPPGKTCVVGAGYIALGFAGFLTGLHQGDVTCLVRSKPLRGLDRDAVGKVINCMKDHGTKLVEGVLPTRVDKLPSGKLLVTLSDGSSDEFDTVLVATGRYADLKGLNIEALNIRTNSKTGKLVCVNEQTNVPHIYAIGTVVDKCPDFNPVAILAGKLLARRLFGNSTELMDYRNVASTVFTPLELGTVGFNEEDAKKKLGAGNVDCVVSSFQPLEWSLTKRNTAVICFTKIVLDTSKNNKVIGMHICAPNAGEIIQGFACAMKKGIVYDDLQRTVGIHPTIAEEFTVMNVFKSSGASAEKAGCRG